MILPKCQFSLLVPSALDELFLIVLPRDARKTKGLRTYSFSATLDFVLYDPLQEHILGVFATHYGAKSQFFFARAISAREEFH